MLRRLQAGATILSPVKISGKILPLKLFRRHVKFNYCVDFGFSDGCSRIQTTLPARDMNSTPAPETSEGKILIEHATAIDQTLAWSQRRAALFRAMRESEEFTKWANGRIYAMRESLGLCPCCPTIVVSCMVKYFRQADTLYGEWDGTEDWKLSPPHPQRAAWYAAQLTGEEAARFWRAIRGEDRITEGDYIRIARTIDTLIQIGGWPAVIPES